jgi:hypothetical protein
LVEHLHGKEGVDGSSPSEGFRFERVANVDGWEDLRMLRRRAIAIVAVVVVVLTDVTWDGTSLHISIGRPGRKRLVELVFP